MVDSMCVQTLGFVNWQVNVPIMIGSYPLLYSLDVTQCLVLVRHQEDSNGQDKVLALQKKLETKQQTREAVQVVEVAVITRAQDDGWPSLCWGAGTPYFRRAIGRGILEEAPLVSMEEE